MGREFGENWREAPGGIQDTCKRGRDSGDQMRGREKLWRDSGERGQERGEMGGTCCCPVLYDCI